MEALADPTSPPQVHVQHYLIWHDATIVPYTYREAGFPLRASSPAAHATCSAVITCVAADAYRRHLFATVPAFAKAPYWIYDLDDQQVAAAPASCELIIDSFARGQSTRCRPRPPHPITSTSGGHGGVAPRWTCTGLTDWIRREGALGNLIVSLAIVVAIWLVRHLALRTTLRRLDAPARYRWRRASFHLAVSLALVLVALIWLGGYRNVALHLGIVTAGLAIALQELIESFAAWLFIEWRRPFTVGDRIQIGERCGDVPTPPFQFALAEIGACRWR